MYKTRRLGVRIPFIGWQANITSEKLEYTRATIANMSTGGAHLITEADHELGSVVNLWIESSQLSFFVTAQVLRNDPYGIAVRFLDLCESDKISILEIITRFLSRGKPERLVAVEKPAVCAETHFREGIRAMIDLAQTQSFEMLKVFLGPSGRTTVKCPFCGKHHHKDVPRHFLNKPVRAKCKCGKSFPVLFDNRGYFRKEVRLAGEYWNGCGEKDLMSITSLSASGAGLEAARSAPAVSVGETIWVSFRLNGAFKALIKTKANIKRIDRNRLGIEFIDLDVHQRKCLGFYLMP